MNIYSPWKFEMIYLEETLIEFCRSFFAAPFS